MIEALSKELQEFGEEILKQLDVTRYKPMSMLWSDTIKENEWILIIAMKFSDSSESISKNRVLYFRDQIYNQVTDIINKLDRTDLSFNFVIVAHDEPFLRLIGEFIATEKDAISSITFNNNTINGQNTGNNYIYRINL